MTYREANNLDQKTIYFFETIFPSHLPILYYLNKCRKHTTTELAMTIKLNRKRHGRRIVVMD